MLLGGGLLTTPSFGFQVIGWDWSWERHPMGSAFEVNVTSFPATVGTPAQVEDALHRAQDLWTDEGEARFAYTWGGLTGSTSFAADGALITQYTGLTGVGSTIAQSQTWGFQDQMLDCDQVFYAQNAFGPIAWSADPAGAPAASMDLEHTAIHEYGHCAGLAHSADPNAVMYNTSLAGRGPADRHLHPDDIAGLQFLYGPAAGAVLRLAYNGAAIAGAPHTFVVSGAAPGEQVYVLGSLAGAGPGPCPQALDGGSICLDIRGPVVMLGQGPADASGRFVLATTLPARLAGATIALQAGVLRGRQNEDSALTQAVSGTVFPVGLTCGPGTEPDCDGACNDSAAIHDGSCDDGTPRPWGSADFNCDAHNHDGGDCP